MILLVLEEKHSELIEEESFKVLVRLLFTSKLDRSYSLVLNFGSYTESKDLRMEEHLKSGDNIHQNCLFFYVQLLEPLFSSLECLFIDNQSIFQIYSIRPQLYSVLEVSVSSLQLHTSTSCISGRTIQETVARYQQNRLSL